MDWKKIKHRKPTNLDIEILEKGGPEHSLCVECGWEIAFVELVERGEGSQMVCPACGAELH